MQDEVKVTQADREAAASIAVLVEMRELILSGRADHHAEPFARHRHQAERETLARMEPVACDRKWAVTLANIRQGRSSTPRCEPPGEYQIELAAEWIKDVLAASSPLYALPPAPEAGQ